MDGLKMLELQLMIDEEELLTAAEDIERLLDDDELLPPMRNVLVALDDAVTLAIQERGSRARSL